MAELTTEPFGQMEDGRTVELWTLRAGEYAAQVLTYGGILRSFTVPAPEGARDIVLGCETLAEYQTQKQYLGALVGRVANRIAGAEFSLNGRRYVLQANDGPNCNHSGPAGFDRALWQAREEQGALVLTYDSPDGESGFPGRLQVQVTYSLQPDGTLMLDYQAQSDKDTLCNLTSHGYFNLLGHAHGGLDGHQVQIFADAVTETGADHIPTGVLLPVAGTLFDLREPRAIRAEGYDDNFVIRNQPGGPLTLAGRVTGGGLCLECLTTQPGLQLYTGNGLHGEPGKGGAIYGPQSGFCLEAQGWPDAIHHGEFPSVVLKAGERYHHITLYRYNA